jgi:hypothetical protein
MLSSFFKASGKSFGMKIITVYPLFLAGFHFHFANNPCVFSSSPWNYIVLAATPCFAFCRCATVSALPRRVGVVLSGCGVFDGSEIQEAVLTLLALDKRGASVECFAPNMEQYHVIDHRNGEEMKEKRNVIVESARISRGIVGDLYTFRACDFDALVFPGGFGAAKNLSSFALEGPKATVHPSVLRAVQEMHTTRKPMG